MLPLSHTVLIKLNEYSSDCPGSRNRRSRCRTRPPFLVPRKLSRFEQSTLYNCFLSGEQLSPEIAK